MYVDRRYLRGVSSFCCGSFSGILNTVLCQRHHPSLAASGDAPRIERLFGGICKISLQDPHKKGKSSEVMYLGGGPKSRKNRFSNIQS